MTCTPCAYGNVFSLGFAWALLFVFLGYLFGKIVRDGVDR